jgi:hypothetical protein
MRLPKHPAWKPLAGGCYHLALGPSRLDIDDLAEISALLEEFDASPPDLYTGQGGDTPPHHRVDLDELAELSAGRRQDITLTSASGRISVHLWSRQTGIVVRGWTSSAGWYARRVAVVVHRRLLLRRIVLDPYFALYVLLRNGSWAALMFVAGFGYHGVASGAEPWWKLAGQVLVIAGIYHVSSAIVAAWFCFFDGTPFGSTVSVESRRKVG